MSTGPPEENFALVYEAAKKVVARRGVRPPGEVAFSHTDGDLEVRRTAADEYEVAQAAGVVFRCRRDGGRSAAHVFAPGEWVARLVTLERALAKSDAAD